MITLWCKGNHGTPNWTGRRCLGFVDGRCIRVHETPNHLCPLLPGSNDSTKSPSAHPLEELRGADAALLVPRVLCG